MAIVQVNKVTKKFGSFTALDGIDLEVNQGEVYGFIGPNGAGKTTTIRILLGILKATSGTATIFGRDAWHDAVEIHKKIAYVPGDVSLWPNLTGGEVIDLFVKLRGGDNKSRREELIERFDLDPTKNAAPTPRATGRRWLWWQLLLLMQISIFSTNQHQDWIP